VLSIVSALTPDFASRFHVLREAFPPGVLDAAAVVTVAFGVGLLWLSRALARRKRRAWQLAVALVLGVSIAHLVKGLDYEETIASVVLLLALLRYRKTFDSPGDPTMIRPLLQVAVALAGIVPLLVLDSVNVFVMPDRLQEGVAALAGVLLAHGLYLWLRPSMQHAHTTQGCRDRARQIVSDSGADTLCFFALRGDKSYFFSPSRRSFLAYRVVNGVALVSGDPIGEASELRELMVEFKRVAEARAWRIAILAAGEPLLPLYRSLGLKPVYLGDEAVVVPEKFSLEGRAIRKVRQSVSRLERAGYRLRVIPVSEVGGRLADELREVSAEWRGRWPERGFTMTMDALFAYPEALVAIAEQEDGRVGGFAHLVPIPVTGGYSLAAMRRRHDAPNGLMEFLLAETIAWARERSVPELSLNFSVFGEVIRAPSSAATSLLRFLVLRLDRVFQLDRLMRFNGKFFPDWRPRYVCTESVLDFPLVGLAYLRAESLLTPPGPWVRSPDLAAR
jgi:lysyl-tRNA synthetase, class II